MKHVFIVNPVSGKADASLYLVPRLIDAAAGAGVDYAVELTQQPGHAAEIARQYGDDGGPVRLYACGGDGTLNEVFTGRIPIKTQRWQVFRAAPAMILCEISARGGFPFPCG